MTELARQKKIRAGHRSSATRLMRQLEEASAVTGGVALERLLQWKLSLNDKLQKLKSLDNEILALVNDNAIDDEIEQADVFSERLQQSIIGVDQLISSKSAVTTTRRSSLTPRTTEPTTESSATAVTETSTSRTIPTETSAAVTTEASTSSTAGLLPTDEVPVVSDVHCRVKLPKLVPKPFNGDLTKWEAFWSTFESSIHLHPTLSAVDKFTYLTSLLEGPAMRAVAGLKLTLANYAEAIDTLKNRFGNKQQIISQHMETLLELETVTSPNNIKALRCLYDQVEFQVRSLKSLKVPLNSYGNLLSSLFMNRLPQELRLIISRQIGEEEWHIDEIMIIVERKICARKRAFTSTSGESHGSGLPTATVLLTSDSHPKCSYCRQGHSSSSCTVVTDIAQRKAILKRAGRCYVCLKRHHLSRDCRSVSRCSRCNGRHHTSICKDTHVNRSSSNGNQSSHSQNNTATAQSLTPSMQLPSSSRLAHTSTASGSPNSATTTGLYCVNTDTPVLLQTAQAYIYNPVNPSHGMTIKLMLDGGSQRSYITKMC